MVQVGRRLQRRRPLELRPPAFNSGAGGVRSQNNETTHRRKRIMATLDILAPLSGHLVPIEEVPDPVFAGKLVGDGISIDPSSGRVSGAGVGRGVAAS